MGTEVSPEMQRAATAWAAQDAADERRTDKQIAEMTTPAGDPDPTPPAAEPAKAAAEPAATSEQLEQLARLEANLKTGITVVWAVLDRLVVRYAGPELALTAGERETLTGASVPVVEKYLPEVLAKLISTPEGMLLLTVGAIYGSKLVLPGLVKTVTPPPAQAPSVAPQPPPTPEPATSPEATA